MVNYIVKQERILKRKKIKEKEERKTKFFLEDVLKQNEISDDEESK